MPDDKIIVLGPVYRMPVASKGNCPASYRIRDEFKDISKGKGAKYGFDVVISVSSSSDMFKPMLIFALGKQSMKGICGY